MGSGGREDIQDLLDKLHDCTSRNDSWNARKARDIVVDISEYLSNDLSPVQYELYLSHVFGEKGVTTFGIKVIQYQTFTDVKISSLDLITVLLQKDTEKIIKYVADIRVQTN